MNFGQLKMKIKTDMYKKHDSLAPGYAASDPFLVLSNVPIPFFIIPSFNNLQTEIDSWLSWEYAGYLPEFRAGILKMIT